MDFSSSSRINSPRWFQGFYGWTSDVYSGKACSTNGTDLKAFTTVFERNATDGRLVRNYNEQAPTWETDPGGDTWIQRCPVDTLT